MKCKETEEQHTSIFQYHTQRHSPQKFILLHDNLDIFLLLFAHILVLLFCKLLLNCSQNGRSNTWFSEKMTILGKGGVKVTRSKTKKRTQLIYFKRKAPNNDTRVFSLFIDKVLHVTNKIL